MVQSHFFLKAAPREIYVAILRGMRLGVRLGVLSRSSTPESSSACGRVTVDSLAITRRLFASVAIERLA